MKRSYALAFINYHFKCLYHLIRIPSSIRYIIAFVSCVIHCFNISKIEFQIFMYLFYFDSSFYTPAIS